MSEPLLDRRRRAPRRRRRRDRSRASTRPPASRCADGRQGRAGRRRAGRGRRARRVRRRPGRVGPHQRHRAGPGAGSGRRTCCASGPRTSPPLEARGAGHPIGDARWEVERGGRHLRVLRRRGQQALRLGRPGAGRRASTSSCASRSASCAPDRAVELPAADRLVEGRPGAGLRQPDHPQAGLADAAHRPGPRRPPGRGRACRPTPVHVLAGPGRRRSATRSWATPASPRSASPARPPPAPTSSSRRPTHITRVSLELGGKSASVVFADADIEKAAAATPMSVFGNAGQDCCARSRILVERSAYDEFVAAFAAATEKRRRSASRWTTPPRWAR